MAGRHCPGPCSRCTLIFASHFKLHGFLDMCSPEERKFSKSSLELSLPCYCSVLDLNAFERQNKAEGLGMVTEEGSGMDYLN